MGSRVTPAGVGGVGVDVRSGVCVSVGAAVVAAGAKLLSARTCARVERSAFFTSRLRASFWAFLEGVVPALGCGVSRGVVAAGVVECGAGVDAGLGTGFGADAHAGVCASVEAGGCAIVGAGAGAGRGAGGPVVFGARVVTSWCDLSVVTFGAVGSGAVVGAEVSLGAVLGVWVRRRCWARRGGRRSRRHSWARRLCLQHRWSGHRWSLEECREARQPRPSRGERRRECGRRLGR